VQSQTGSKNNLLFAAMIVIAVIVLIYYKKKTKAKEEQKLRQKQLQYDYSEVISKLTLLLGAGESVETALNYVMSYEDYTRNGVIDINVKSLGENPHSMLTTDKQTLKRIIDNALNENEDKAVIELPDTINNTSVTYAYVQSQTGSKNKLQEQVEVLFI
jgi:LPXTG-motif cell wall-anchored protein